MPKTILVVKQNHPQIIEYREKLLAELRGKVADSDLKYSDEFVETPEVKYLFVTANVTANFDQVVNSLALAERVDMSTIEVVLAKLVRQVEEFSRSVYGVYRPNQTAPAPVQPTQAPKMAPVEAQTGHSGGQTGSPSGAIA